MEGISIFSLPRDVSVTDVAAAVGDGGRCRVHGPLRGARERLDTFDWRLLGAGAILEYEVASGLEPRLRMIGDGAGPGGMEIQAPHRPVFCGEIAAMALRRHLAPVMGERALLTRNRIGGTLHEIRVEDRRGKTVARLDLWRPSRRGECVARSQPVRGFDDQAARVARRLRERAGARALEHDPLWQDTSDGRGPPGGYPGWPVDGLRADLRTDDALQLALAHYRRVMDLNLAGICEDLDTEFLHDFRVGLRRSRTLLRRVQGVFPDARLAPFLEDLSWLAAVTGPARDADVHCLVFPDYVASLDEAAVEALTPMFDLIALERREAHGVLVESLRSAHIRRRWAAWGRFLATPMPRASRQPAGPQPVRRSGADAILAAEARVTRRGRKITAASRPERYHTLRKRCKDLRYLIDLFGNLFESKTLLKSVRRLKKLQDVLGEHQDLDVHRAALRTLHARLAESGQLPGETHAAMERLLAELGRRSERARQGFPSCFAKYLEVCPDRAALDAGT